MSVEQMETIQGIYPAAKVFAREHGRQCAKEILEWRRTGIYSGSRLADSNFVFCPECGASICINE